MIKPIGVLSFCLFFLACATPAPTEKTEPAAKPSTGLRTSAEVSDALDRAQSAYLAGKWGDAVVEANKVMEGAATPDEYYMAVKLLGLASCNRRDPRPVAFSWKRMQPIDRDALRSACEQNGLEINEQGEVKTR
jgi:hypothetical protein